MYFDTAELTVADLVARVAALESATPAVDVVQLQADVATVSASLSDALAAVAALDARLDAIAAGAVG